MRAWVMSLMWLCEEVHEVHEVHMKDGHKCVRMVSHNYKPSHACATPQQLAVKITGFTVLRPVTKH